MSVDISVLIATRNRADSLGRTLESLAAQQADGHFTYEVVVVDNGSTDGTRRAVEQLRPGYPVALRYLYEPRVGKAWAVNAGLEIVSGELVAFTDDDVVLSPVWLAALRACFDEEQADGVGGRILPQLNAPRPDWWLTDAVAQPFLFGALGCVDHGSRRLLSTPAKPRYWVGGNLALRRSIVAQLGGIDVRLTRGEDSEYHQRCLRHGKRIVYEPAALAYHRIGADRLTPEYFRAWWYGRGRFRAYRLPWTLWHLVTVQPLSADIEVLRLALLWGLATALGRPFGRRFWYEVRLREQLSCWNQRLRLLPGVWGAVLRRGPRVLWGSGTTYLDLYPQPSVTAHGGPSR